MKAADAVAEILSHRGVAVLIGYPVSPIVESAACADMPTGSQIADGLSRVTSAERIGAMPSRPATRPRTRQTQAGRRVPLELGTNHDPHYSVSGPGEG